MTPSDQIPEGGERRPGDSFEAVAEAFAKECGRSGDRLDRVALAIFEAGCPGREGPFGLYDYSRYPGETPPHQVRDFRDPSAPDYGRRVFCGHDPEQARRLFDLLTARHIANAALEAAQ